MTAYEIADLRATIGDRILSILRFWLTVTMAVFAVAYYAGSQLDGFSVAALIVFHGTMSMLCGSLGSLAYAQVSALKVDGATLAERGDSAAIVNVEMKWRPSTGRYAIWGTLIVTFVMFLAYLLRMTV